jgi:5-(carboxyamino)imidazole ribonucleotide synthase
MIGAGQLARMTHQAAVDLDVELTVLAQSATDPAVLAGAAYRIGSHTDASAVAGVAGLGEVVTFDHELVPPALLADLETAGIVLRPDRRALGFAQDKLAARADFRSAGFAVPEFAPVRGAEDVADFAAEHGWPVVVKARSGGYDGRGVVIVGDPTGLPPELGPGAAADNARTDDPATDNPAGGGWAGEPQWLVEEHVDLVAELAVVVARRPSGASAVYPVIETTQVDGICRHLVTPAGSVGPDVIADAGRLAGAVTAHIGAVGICAVELFVAAGGRLLVNEVAVRPHNSGHASIEANTTSQFHQHLRAVLDWPLGPTDLVAPAAAMVNLIGTADCADPSRNLPAALLVDGVHVHLYGKESRPGRKIGHVTALADTTAVALDAAGRAVDALLAP